MGREAEQNLFPASADCGVDFIAVFHGDTVQIRVPRDRFNAR